MNWKVVGLSEGYNVDLTDIWEVHFLEVASDCGYIAYGKTYLSASCDWEVGMGTSTHGIPSHRSRRHQVLHWTYTKT